MKSEDLVKKIRRELKDRANQEYKNSSQRFFKERIVCYGVPTPIVRQIAKKYFKSVQPLGKRKLFVLSEQLLKSRYNEETTIAIQWLGRFSGQFQKGDFKILEKWLGKYIDNWAKGDDFCLHLLQPMIDKYPVLVSELKLWTKSENKWLRRASAVSLITTDGSFYVTKHNLKDVFTIASCLLNDQEDLVQKAYGWMLKSASVYSQKEVFDFVMRHKSSMPRTALRYAIEKMPTDLKKQAMKRD